MGKKRGFLFQLDVLVYGSVPEKIADLSESPDIFVLMCARLPGPERLYGKSAEQVDFFAAHDERGAKVTPIDEILLTR